MAFETESFATESFADVKSSRPGSGARRWAILGGGFALGVLIGAMVIFGPADPSSSQNDIKVEAGVPELQAATSEAGSDGRAEDLASERDRLQQELEAEKLRREVAQLKHALSDLQAAPDAAAGANPSPPTAQGSIVAPRAETPTASSGAVTLAYWNQMNAIILQEATLRTAPAGGVTASNAGGFLDARVQAAEFAVESLQALNSDGVDPRVVQLCRKLGDWYQDGRTVAEMGKNLLTGGSLQDRQGAAGKKYQAAERNYSKSVNAINAEGEQVRQAVSRQYGLTFPPLN